MAKPINLNKVRKARAKSEKRKRSDENAAKFGRSKADKERDGVEVARLRRDLDGHKLEGDGQPE